MKLLIAIPICANDAILAERHLDFIFRLNEKKAIGSCLLVFNSDVHQEMKLRIKVSAELAFVHVRETVAPKLPDNLASNKFQQLNNMFRHTAAIAQKQCRWPWLWLEPDCVPVQPYWIEQLAETYDSQPAKYLGFIGKTSDGTKFMARLGIYFTGASYELDTLCQADVPFAIATSLEVVPKCTHTDLIQYLNIERVDDLKNISAKAVVIHGDKAGIFQENWMSPEQVRAAVESRTELAVLNSTVELPSVTGTKTPDVNEARENTRSRRRQAASV